MAKSVKSSTESKSTSKLVEPVKGRPTKYKPEYCEMLITHMKNGYSFMSFAAIAEVDYDTVYEWDRVHPDFSEARKKGIALQLMYDETLLNELTKGFHGKSASAATHIFKMKNCHKWSDKTEIEQTNKNIQINIDSDDSKL